MCFNNILFFFSSLSEGIKAIYIFAYFLLALSVSFSPVCVGVWLLCRNVTIWRSFALCSCLMVNHWEVSWPLRYVGKASPRRALSQPPGVSLWFHWGASKDSICGSFPWGMSVLRERNPVVVCVGDACRDSGSRVRKRARIWGFSVCSSNWSPFSEQSVPLGLVSLSQRHSSSVSSRASAGFCWNRRGYGVFSLPCVTLRCLFVQVEQT